MGAARDWRTEGVKIVRAGTIKDGMTGPGGTGRVTVYDFLGTGGEKTWVGMVTLPPAIATGLHHHGRHELAVYVVDGRSEIRWGERLEYAAIIEPGDWAYFPPEVPHQERNIDGERTLTFLVVRSDNERIAVPIPGEIVETPETVC
jgi:uncharacterized RmlC-like cupin family protein